MIYVYCPFCKFHFPIDKGHRLMSMGNADLVYCDCTECKKEFWILETDYDEVSKASATRPNSNE